MNDAFEKVRTKLALKKQFFEMQKVKIILNL